MRVTLMGHATMLVELDGANVLMDPVFVDPYEDGAVTSCPSRQIFVDRFPKIDAVIISHGHLDHFDVRSLDMLPRDCELFCPCDPVIPYVLRRLGFQRIRTLEHAETVAVGRGEILTTFSNIDVIEFGVVFKDSSGTFWNQVDTVVTPGTIEYTKLQIGHIDLLFSAYASQNLGFFSSMRAGYPLDIPRANLTNVRQIAPTLVAPGSAGFRFAGALEWTNPFVFPISREQFLSDLARVAPRIRSTIANPGDVFEIDGGEVARRAGASTIARMVEDDTHLIDFDATAPVPPLIDSNPLGYSDEAIAQQVDATVHGLIEFVARASSAGASDPLIDELRRLRASFALGIVFPNAPERWIHIRFGAAGASIDPDAAGPLPAASTTHRIAASILTARARYEKSYCYYRGFSRLTQTLAGTTSTGEIVHEEKELPDLLGYYLDRKAPDADRAAFRRMDFQIDQLRAAPR